MQNTDTNSQRITLENLIDEACGNGYKEDVIGVLRNFNAKGANDVHSADLSEAISRIQYFATAD